MMPIPIYILAGGRSSRFGSDKARAGLGPGSLLEGVVEALKPAASRLTLVVQDVTRYEDLGVRRITDDPPGLGPMGGLMAALHDAAGEDWIFLSACDWAGLRPSWVERLWMERSAGSDIVVFEAPSPEPLFGCYRTSILPVVEAHIADGRRAMRSLLGSLRVRSLEAPAGWDCAANINTPEDLNEWVRGKEA